MLCSILESEGIGYYIRNDIFGSMEVGVQIPFFNAKTIMVSEEDAERAQELIGDYIRETAETPGSQDKPPETRGRFRMLLEFLLFGWILPGGRGRRQTRNSGKD
ncbi:MAG: hypothetical protein OHK006_15710 [Thermodesulfovibrionales bacterium]